MSIPDWLTAPHRGFSGPMKHNQRNHGTEQQLLRIPTGQRQTIWLFTKCSREVEPWISRVKFNEWSQRALNLGSPDVKGSALTTGPHYLLTEIQSLTSGLFPVISTIYKRQGVLVSKTLVVGTAVGLFCNTRENFTQFLAIANLYTVPHSRLGS